MPTKPQTKTSARNTPSPSSSSTEKRSVKSADKDAPLKEDIRLLGRLLGEVLRDQEGDAVFEVVETIRQTAVRFRRESDAKAGAELDKLLKKLTRDQTNSVVRAFSYFSRLDNAGVSGNTVRNFLSESLISPVLTAHPTEVQRKSILDAEREIARLLAL